MTGKVKFSGNCSNRIKREGKMLMINDGLRSDIANVVKEVIR